MPTYNQTATLWESTGISVTGDETFSAPQQISVRWERRISVAYNEEQGSEIRTQNIVYVQQDIKTGSWLLEGTSNAADPTQVEGARKVVEFRRIPNLRGTREMRAVLL